MKRLINRLRSDEGFTIVELMMVSVLSTLIVFSALSLLEGATRAESGAQGRYDVQLAVRSTMLQTTKLTRQALSISPASTTSRLEMDTLIAGATHHVVLDISGTSLRMTDTTSGIGPTVMVRNLTNTAPFCYDPPTCAGSGPSSPTAIRITVAAKPDKSSAGTVPITLSDDVQLRNL